MLATLLSLLLTVLPVFAATPAPLLPDTASVAVDTTLALAEITVTATRLETSSLRAPSRLTVITPQTADHTAARSLAELLDARSPAFMRRYGPGGLASMSLRGAGSSQNLVLLDGQRIASPQNGQLDFALLPTALFQTIEILHGTGSSLYGSDAMGSVVNLRTAPPGDAASWSLSGTTGAFGERATSARFSAGSGALHATALVDYSVTDGDFSYRDPAAFPPQSRRRANADAVQFTTYSSLAHTTERQTLRVSGWYSNAERGLPGTAGGRASNERQRDESFRLWSSLQREVGNGTIRIGSLVQHASLRYQNPSLSVDDTGRTLTASIEAEWQGPLRNQWNLSTGAEAAYQQAAHPSLANEAREGTLASYLTSEIEIGHARIFPSLRVDTYIRPADTGVHAVPSPHLGLNWRLRDGLHAKASAGRSFRMPTFNDRYWQPGGNPDLSPENGWAADGGLIAAGGSQRAEVSAFGRTTRNQIVWQPTGGGRWSPFNIQQTRAIGLEAAYHVHVHAGAGVEADGSVHYTYTAARDISTPGGASFGQPLRYVPPNLLRGHLTTRRGPLALDLSAAYTGRRYVTTDASQYLDPYATVDAHLRWIASLGDAELTLGAEARNLFDTQYVVLQGYPMPRRHLRLHLTLTSSK